MFRRKNERKKGGQTDSDIDLTLILSIASLALAVAAFVISCIMAAV